MDTKTRAEHPYRIDAESQWMNAQILMREINRIQFIENFKTMAPEIAMELKKQGVVFP